jgi:hypothetical protein
MIELDVDTTAYYGNHCIFTNSKIMNSTETKLCKMKGHLLTNIKP